MNYEEYCLSLKCAHYKACFPDEAMCSHAELGSFQEVIKKSEELHRKGEIGNRLYYIIEGAKIWNKLKKSGESKELDVDYFLKNNFTMGDKE